MPDYAVKKLEAVFKTVLNHDRFKKFYTDAVIQPYWMSSVEYGKFLDAESNKWKERLASVGLLKK